MVVEGTKGKTDGVLLEVLGGEVVRCRLVAVAHASPVQHVCV